MGLTKRVGFGLLASLALMACAKITLAADAPLDITGVLHGDQKGPVIAPEIYGQFAEHLGRGIYEGIYVGEKSPIPNTRGMRNDVVGALKDLAIPDLRWPGGCFADRYHWMDGIGPKEKRPKLINTNWGGAVEDNSFGTHEFMDLCEQLGTQPYVAMNMGSGTVKEMMEWIDYMTSDADSPMANLRRQNGHEKPWKVKYIGIGNESWGCGGNMTPEYYANEYRRYNAFALDTHDNKLFRIACGPNEGNTDWTDKVMAGAARNMNGISLHYYTLPTGNWTNKGSGTVFDEAQYAETLQRAARMDELIKSHLAVMDKYDPRHRVSLLVDEWGVWTDPEPGSTPGFLYQQNTLRDVIAAAMTLHIFHNHADRVGMANIAQMVNVLQAMVLTDKEKMVLTPTYHLFKMYKVHQGATSLPVELKSPDYAVGAGKIPAVSVSASRDKAGAVHVSLVNANPNLPANISLDLPGVEGKSVTASILTADKITSHNTFDNPNEVKTVAFDGAKLEGGKLVLSLPAKAVVMVELK